ncbi:MFS transporter [Niveispirillum sp. BGYR6]|uniref:MFS transporter n=1 Tax=Niveispirillum sp. BGYR6 TaxID=2971249 RepID=UPI0022B9AD31|nr:MFS transporter [Niveispirillum sp. BGYR6]MDG5493810.1 MFS transporter [Niveispirillum sp. BGYR6]
MRSGLMGTLATLAALLLGFGLLQLGNNLQGTLLAVRGGLEAFSPTQVGLIGSGFSIGLVLGSLTAGTLIQSVGHIRTFAALAALASASALLHVMLVHPVAWIGFRMVTGLCFAGLLMSVESWLNASATPAVRGQILGIYSMTGLIAAVGGQMLLPLADPGGFMLFACVSLIISIALVPVALSKSQAPAEVGARTRANLRHLYRQSPFGLVAAFLCGISTGAFYALGPLYAQQAGFDDQGIALFMACAILGAFATTWPLGFLSDRMDRRRLVIIVALASALLLAAMMLFLPQGMAPGWVFFLVFAFGGVVLPTYGMVVAHVNDSVHPTEFIAASGGLLIVQGSGMALGPLLGGAMMEAMGRNGLPWLVVLAQGLVAVWGAYRISRRAAPVEKEQFVNMTVSPVGTTLIEATQEAKPS